MWFTDQSFEVGPIRPPSEAHSLLVRVTRNCPWNRCTFCPVYKGKRFELRSVEEIEGDIANLTALVRRLAERLEEGDGSVQSRLEQALAGEGRGAAQVALFVLAGGRNVFLQDANSLLLPVDKLVRVLGRLRQQLPSVTRVTTYARSHTVSKRSVEQLRQLREAGLDRIHVGLESGSDRVLAMARKGVTAAQHIEAGQRAKQAGLELSAYVMPGLGGRALSEEHARETARVLREIDPDFIRLRTLAVAPASPLAEQWERGEFEPLDDVEVAHELRRLLDGLGDVHATVRSDHVLNLLEEVEGKLPDELARMRAVVDRFLALDQREREAFIVGRRFGVLRRLDDLHRPRKREQAHQLLAEVRRRFPAPLDQAIRQIMTQFI